MSHLTVHWVAGRPEHPVQRWVVFECVPRAAFAMQGEDHPLLGLLDPAGDVMHRWAHEYLTRTGCLPVG